MKEKIADFGIRSTLKILHSNPEKALPRLVSVADTFAHSTFPAQMDAIKEAVGNTDSNIYQMLVRVLKERDADEVDNLIANFLENAGVKGWNKQKELREKYNCNIPWAILLDPTSACNLHCKGCWAADYGNRLNLTYDDIDDIIRQGEELGTYMYIYTGGEPLVRKDDLIKLCEAHPECTFLCFTNGTLIDQKFCDDLKRVKNFVPALSVEGNRETTDFRRGEGVYDRCVHAMNLMKENGLIFGISCCYTSENYDVVSSSEYLDQMIDWGAVFVWYFHYMPVGSDANIELMCTPEQREEMYRRVRHYRETKSIFPMDFQNDGQSVQGCIAGGRRYLHINAAGDVDPCVFIHFSDSNIHEKTLLECLRSPLCQAYHDNQPFNENMLRPCPMLENPDELRRIVKESGAQSSNLEAAETVDELCDRCDAYAKAWKPTADKLWEKDHRVGTFSH